MTNESEYNIEKSILRCLRDQEFPEIFFSLMDYRNNYFLSSDPKDIIHFYEGFENKEELIDWMKERPKGSCEIMEVEGEKDIIVVIPTADFEGEYAKRCREEIFKGLHIIFVVSGKGNNYFNYAHNCNVGIKMAMEYNPKWIILSNDDMYKIDDVDVLRGQLYSIDQKNYDIVFTKPSRYHSILSRIIKINSFYDLFHRVTNYDAGRTNVKLYKKFNVEFTSMRSKYALIFSFPLKGLQFIETLNFQILSYEFVEQVKRHIFDETYINGKEDDDLSLKMSLEGRRFAIINYKIGDYMGSSFGLSDSRWIRNVANSCYFNFKWKDVLQKLFPLKQKE